MQIEDLIMKAGLSVHPHPPADGTLAGVVRITYPYRAEPTVSADAHRRNASNSA